MMTQTQPNATAATPAVEIATLAVRVAPLTAAMLDQVPDGDILDCEAGALRGEPIGKVLMPDNAQLLWMRGRDLRRCVIPETKPSTPLSAEERALRDRVQAELQRIDAAAQAVTKASRFADLAAALSTNGQFRGGDWRGRLGEIIGTEMSVLEEADARGEIGPTQLDGSKVRVLASLAAEKVHIEASAEKLACLAAAREAKDAELAALVAQLAAVSQVFLP